MKKLFQCVRDWLIKKLGGYTAKEYYTVTKIPVQVAIPIESRNVEHLRQVIEVQRPRFPNDPFPAPDFMRTDMDYKEQIAYLHYLEQQSQHIEASAFARAARSITDLLARAEAAEALAEKAEKKLETAVGTIYALVADCPPEACREICANHNGVCAEHAKMGHYGHCKGFKWIGEKEE